MQNDNRVTPDSKDEGKDERKTEQIWTGFVRASSLTIRGLGEKILLAHLHSKARVELS